MLLDLLGGDRALLGQRLRLSLGPLPRWPCAQEQALTSVVPALVTSVHDHRVVAGARKGVCGVLLLALRSVVEPPAVVNLTLRVLRLGREPRGERCRPGKPVRIDAQ